MRSTTRDEMDSAELGGFSDSSTEMRRKGGYRFFAAGASTVACLLLLLGSPAVFTNKGSKLESKIAVFAAARKLLSNSDGATIPQPPGVFSGSITEQTFGGRHYSCGQYSKTFGEESLTLSQCISFNKRVLYYREPLNGEYQVFKREFVQVGITDYGEPEIETILSVVNPSCPLRKCEQDDGVVLSDKCFYAPRDDEGLPQNGTWGEALQVCQVTSDSTGTLAQIYSEEENTVAYDLAVQSGGIGSHAGMWVGAHNDGQHAEHQNGFAWTEGGLVTNYPQFWAPQEPNNYEGNEYCTELYYLEYKWNDDDCSKKQPFLCSRPERVSDCDVVDFLASVVEAQ